MSSQLLEPGLLSVVVDASAGVDVIVLTEVVDVDGASVVVVVGPKLQFVNVSTILCITYNLQFCTLLFPPDLDTLILQTLIA